MIFTFYKARGMSVGSSLVEEDKLDLAKRLEEAAKAKGVEFILPTDVIAADKFDENANTKVVAAGEIPEGWMVSQKPHPALPPPFPLAHCALLHPAPFHCLVMHLQGCWKAFLRKQKRQPNHKAHLQALLLMEVLQTKHL